MKVLNNFQVFFWFSGKKERKIDILKVEKKLNSENKIKSLLQNSFNNRHRDNNKSSLAARLFFISLCWKQWNEKLKKNSLFLKNILLPIYLN